MKKLTSFINEANKQDFTKKILLTLDNNVILEAKISVKDLNESFANVQISEALLNKKIEKISIITESEENLVDSTITVEPIDESNITELYIPWSSIFTEAPYYQADKIANAIQDDEDVVSTYTENQYGWSNQPEVVVVKVESPNIKATKERLKAKLQHALGTEWVRITEKDW
ncbi:MAG: hypothetical protein RLZZ546_545 [Bacteroidota bacterium]|jgi:hypothetical protein